MSSENRTYKDIYYEIKEQIKQCNLLYKKSKQNYNKNLTEFNQFHSPFLEEKFGLILDENIRIIREMKRYIDFFNETVGELEIWLSYGDKEFNRTDVVTINRALKALKVNINTFMKLYHKLWS